MCEAPSRIMPVVAEVDYGESAKSRLSVLDAIVEG